MNTALKDDIFVSAVAVLSNHGAVLKEFVQQVYELLDVHYANYEIVLVDSGSHDRTAEVARQLLAQYNCLHYQRLTSRVDDEIALLAGLDAAIGDYVVTLNPNFDPPEEIVPLVEACRSGTEVVLGVDLQRSRPGPIYRLLRSIFFGLARWLVKTDLPTGTTGLALSAAMPSTPSLACECVAAISHCWPPTSA